MRTHEERKRLAQLPLSERIAEQELRHCRHFTGTFFRRCAEGVDYDTVMDEKRSYPEERLACHRDGPDLCPLREFLTPEEAREKGREAEAAAARSMTAFAAVKRAAGSERGIRGSIKCPCCADGTIHYSVARSNGHTSARCSTKGCVAWIE